jgi:copper chaperone NosL
MRKIALLAALAGALALSGCNDQTTAEAPPPPYQLTASAIGHYCGMNVMEHTGPKAQIILASQKDPVWFSSARDALSFTMLPEEPKDIRAIYVSDMSKAPTWDNPGADNWVDAKQAFFVVGSRMKGGMGADEAVPFSDKNTAEKFASENGGRIMAFAEVPKEYVLGTAPETTSSTHEEHSAGEHHAGHASPAPAKDGHAHH